MALEPVQSLFETPDESDGRLQVVAVDHWCGAVHYSVHVLAFVGCCCCLYVHYSLIHREAQLIMFLARDLQVGAGVCCWSI